MFLSPRHHFAKTVFNLLALLTLLLLTRPAQADLPSATNDILGPATDRSPGTPGAQASADYLAAQLHRRTGQPVFRQRFTLVVPIVDRCTASALPDEKGSGFVSSTTTSRPAETPIPLAPLLPSGAQPAALPPQYRDLPTLYLGQGHLTDLRNTTLADHFAILEITSDPIAWQTAAALGARGIIFLGNPQTPIQSFLDKNTSIPVGIPRFYCDDPAAVAAFRAGAIGRLRIDLAIRWTERPVENLLCLIPGRQTTPLPAAVKDKNWFNQLVVLQTRYDASSQVLTRAPGATQALNAAAALDLAAQLAAAPDRLSTLIALTAGDQWNNRGTRTLYQLLGRGYNTPVQYDLDLARKIAAQDEKLRLTDSTIQGLEDFIAGRLPALRLEGARQAIAEQMLRQTSALEERLQRSRLRQSPSPAGEVQNDSVASLDALKRAALSANAVLTNQQDPTPEDQTILTAAAQSVLPLWQTERSRTAAALENLRQWPPFRQALGPRFPMLHLTLALSTGNDQFGFFARSHYAPQADQTGRMSPFAQQFRRCDQLVRDRAAAEGRPDAFVPDTMENRFTLESYFPIKLAFSSDAAGLAGQPAGALATIRDNATALDTPADTLDQLDFTRAQTQVKDLQRLLVGGAGGAAASGGAAGGGALTDPFFYGRTQLPCQLSDQTLTLLEPTHGETVPSLGAPEVLIGGESQNSGRPLGPELAGTRRLEWYITHVDGTSVFESVPMLGRFRLQALDFAPDGAPRRTLAATDADTRGLVADFAPDASHPQRAMLFDAQRLDAFGLFDPRYMEYLDRIDVLDARRRDKAQASSVFAGTGLAAVFMPRAIRWQLLVSKGSVGNRMLLINADAENPEGRGFESTDLALIGPLAYRSTLDLAALNAHRQHDLEKFGISSDLIKDLQKRSAAALAEADRARSARDYLAWSGATAAAWSLQSQVYQNLIDTSNGIIKGVIFLLLGIIPFSYFLERLLIGATNVYRQIAWFAAFFLAMTAALWFHPAFRISSAPLMILLAFLILILSSTVVYILFGKFEEEVSRLRGVAASAHSTSLKRAAVLGAAIRLGLSNMRRRGTRTTLTLLTLVLLTFTLLCFTSVRESVQVTPRRVTNMPPNTPPGILLRLRSWRPLPLPALQSAAELAATEHPAGSPLIAQRWWFASERAEQPWFIPLQLIASTPTLPPATTPTTLPASTPEFPATRTSPRATTFYAAGLLGLEPAEAAFHAAPLAAILPGFERLSADQAPALCWLPDSIRDSVPINTGDTVDLLGTPLTVAGFFDPQAFAALRSLTGDPLTPVDPVGSASAPGGGASAANSSDENSARPENASRFLDPSSIAIVPAPLVRAIGGRLTSIMLRPAPTDAPNPEPLLQRAADFARRSAFTVYVSDGREVQSINADEASRPQDLGTVLVPMLIAGVIVLNTMLGAVAERSREIHVYTSVGLAPAHVGMLFLAEAAALGTLGVVFGYIFGQALATLLTWTGIMSGVDLNYSSMSAIITMGLVLILVMASSLWPAHAATRVAAPSLQRDWKLPQPDGDTLRVELPFTVNQAAALGVCAFLEEFLLSTSQAGTGHFNADNIKAFVDQTPAGLLHGLACRIWLAPYDLGVIQALWLGIYPTPDRHVFEVKLMIIRESGNPATWHRLNRPFLVEIRKQFLLWRALTPQLTQDYIQKSEALFHPQTK